MEARTTRALYSLGGRSEDWLRFAETMRDSAGWEPCYWICSQFNHEKIRTLFPETIRHQYLMAMRGLPAENGPSIIPRTLDEPTLARFRPYQSVALSMMDRMGVLGSFSYRERARHFHRLLAYWLGVFDLVHPDVAFFASSPHEVADYMAYVVCHEMGCRTLILVQTSLPSVTAVRSGIDEGLIGLDCASEAPREQNRGAWILDSEAVSAYLRRQRGSYDDARPDYMKRQLAEAESDEQLRLRRRLPQIHRFMRRGLKALKFWRWPHYVQSLKLARTDLQEINGQDAYKKRGLSVENSWMTNGEVAETHARFRERSYKLRAEYEVLVTSVDLGTKYVFLPLHYQPERTTCPEAGIFRSQMLIVDLLHEALPPDCLLYVREHPSQFVPTMRGAQGRDPVFYSDLVAHPRVRLVGQHVSSFDLIDSSIAVATATGTAGWEALLRGRPALVFGNAWYQECPGAFRIRSLDDAVAALSTVAEGAEVPFGDVRDFLRRLSAVSWPVDTMQGREFTSQLLSPEENVAGLVSLAEHATGHTLD